MSLFPIPGTPIGSPQPGHYILQGGEGTWSGKGRDEKRGEMIDLFLVIQFMERDGAGLYLGGLGTSPLNEGHRVIVGVEVHQGEFQVGSHCPAVELSDKGWGIGVKAGMKARG